jgi:hypothetical protein
VHVQGRVNEAASFGNQSLGLHLDETNRLIKASLIFTATAVMSSPCISRGTR